MITIEHLEVQFDVEGDSDEQVFARHFARFIEQWARAQEQDQAQRERLARDQQIGADGSYR
ncbi:MAG: putative phage tail protein [Gammaproteobacteria bacterium]